MNLRNLIYQNLHEQKTESELYLKTALLRQLEVEAKAQERDAKASLATIDFEKCDLPAPMRLGRDRAPNEQPELMPDTGAAKGKPKKTVFDKRLGVLKHWLTNDLRFTLTDEIIVLPKHYTLELVYGELCKKDNLFLSIELKSFDAHFWGKQKIVELTRGNKSAIL